MEELLKDIPIKELISSAMEAKKKAYAPYSGYLVGAAVLTADMRIYTGCNIENVSFTPSICAERTAISKAVSEGTRRILAIAVTGSLKGEEPDKYAYPCGVCRQVMLEFAEPERFVIIVAKSQDEYKVHTLAELLPESFGTDQLERK